jgi:hypothetical protein
MRDRLGRWAAATVAVLALAASAIGIANGFTYDDRYIVELNPTVTTFGAWWRVFAQPYWPANWGGDGYRPLTILAFKIEHALGGGAPMLFHAVNVLLYALASMLVLALARRLLPLWAAWLVAALFAVHPVHVEAVANVVGQSELLVAVAVLGALVLYLRDRRAGPLRPTTAAAILAIYAVGCFAKEHAIVLPAILLAAELTVLSSDAELRADLRRPAFRVFFLAMALVGVAFVGVRSLVLFGHGVGGFTPFTPFSSLKITGAQRVLTAVGVVPQWFRLFYFPLRLSSEYGPPDIPIAQGIEMWQLPGFLLLIATLAIGVLLRRRQPVIAFGIAFGCIALLPASNFVVPAGIVLAERTLLLPSVGAMLVVGGACMAVARRYAGAARRPSPAALVVVTIVLSAGIARSASRTVVWKSNESLFAHAVLDAPDAYRSHYMRGAWLVEQKDIRRGEAEYRQALKLFPYDPAVSFNLAEQYRKAGMCEPSLPLYQWTRELDPAFPFGRVAYAECLVETGHYAEGKRMAYQAFVAGAQLSVMRRIVFVADSLAASTKGSGDVRLAGAAKP